MSRGCSDCISRNFCQSAQGSCSNYEREPTDFYKALGFNSPTRPDKKAQAQSTQNNESKESAD